MPILGIAKNTKAAPSLCVSVDAFMANLGRVRLSDNPSSSLVVAHPRKLTYVHSAHRDMGFSISELRRFSFSFSISDKQSVYSGIEMKSRAFIFPSTTKCSPGTEIAHCKESNPIGAQKHKASAEDEKQ